jgi:hypothetical protein
MNFLEWFVNNPSCEEVEIKDSKIVKEHILGDGYRHDGEHNLGERNNHSKRRT